MAQSRTQKLNSTEATHCSPARYCHHRKTGTCLKTNEMVEVLRAHGVKADETDPTDKLMGQMRSAAHTRGMPPNSEHLLADLAVARMWDAGLRQKIRGAYRPAAPAKWAENGGGSRGVWLSSEDIAVVMKQYDEALPDFKFVDVAPIDFADKPVKFGGRCVSPGMCSLDVAGLLAEGVTKHLGVVLNMDKHDSRGSHWVALYVGLDPAHLNYGVFYYDSVANPPKERVVKWMRGVAAAVASAPRDRKHVGVGPTPLFKVEYNTTRKQFGHTECGMFSMMFLIHCMQRKLAFRDICKTLGNDAVMREMRDILFRPPPGQVKIKNAIALMPAHSPLVAPRSVAVPSSGGRSRKTFAMNQTPCVPASPRRVSRTARAVLRTQ